MFSLKDAYTNITLDYIFSKISEYELWLKYCPNFKKFDESFHSEFYRDNNPDCRLFKTEGNRIRYKDFGNGDNLSIIEYIQKKYLCDFKECLTIISNDFKLYKSSIIVNKETRLLNFEENIPKIKTKIDIISQPFTITDFNYWSRYSIPLDLLQEYNIFSCKTVYIIKNDKVIIFNYNKNNPIYAYRFVNNGGYSYKIYFPFADKKYKWLFSGGTKEDIEGYNQLSLNGSKLILTKSLKDCISFRLIGYDAISLQGEANKLDIELVNKLLKRFDTIITVYDNDEEGIRGANRIYKDYGFKYFFVDNHKDLSDYIKNEGLDKAKIMIKRKLEEIDEG